MEVGSRDESHLFAARHEVRVVVYKDRHAAPLECARMTLDELPRVAAQNIEGDLSFTALAVQLAPAALDSRRDVRHARYVHHCLLSFSSSETPWLPGFETE